MLPSPFKLVDHAVAVGLQFIAITDHDSQESFEVVQEYALSKGLVVVPSVEITTRSRRLSRKRIHILAYGVTDKIRSRKSIKDTIAAIHEQGGLAVIAHPFCSRFGKVLYLGHQTGDYRFDGVEVFNSDEEPIDNMRARALALVLDLPEFGGSDAHVLHNIGNTRVEVPIAHTTRWQDIIHEMRQGNIKIITHEYNHSSERQSTLHIMAHAFIPAHEDLEHEEVLS
jgi:predicted metal-dependent phosphoesterase TrpH